MTDRNNTVNTPEENEKCDHKDGKNGKRSKGHKVMIVAGVSALIGIAALAGVAESSGWGEHGSWNQMHNFHGSHSSHGGQAGMMNMFEEFDADSDGKLTGAELDAARTSRFDDADGNNDAALDLSEFEGLWVNLMRSHMVDKFQMLDDDGDGRVTGQEFARPFGMAMQYMDRNDDGTLEMREMKRTHRNWNGQCDYCEKGDRD